MALAGDSLLSVVVYLVIGKSLVPHALTGLLGEVPWPIDQEAFWGCVLTLLAFFPLALLRDTKSLQYLGGAGFLAIVYFSALLGAEYFLLLSPAQRQENARAALHTSPSLLGVLSPLPIYLYGFSFQVAVPAVHLDLRRRSLPRMKQAITAALLLALLIYGLVGAFGLLSLAHEAPLPRNLLLADLYAARPEFQCVFLLYAAMLLMTSAIRFSVGKHTLRQLLWRGAPMRGCGNFWLSSGLVALILLCELLVPHIALLIQFIGSTTTPFVCYVAPLLFFLKTRQTALCSVKPIFALFMLFTVCLLAALSLYSTVASVLYSSPSSS